MRFEGGRASKLTEIFNLASSNPSRNISIGSAPQWVSLEARGLGSNSIVIRMSAIRKLSPEAADNDLLAPELLREEREVGGHPHGQLAIGEAGPNALEHARYHDAS